MTLPRYPKYKNSGVEWLGKVPEHWAVEPIKRRIARVESGTSVNASDEPATDGRPGVLKTSCVYAGIFDPAENKLVAHEDIERVSCPVKPGTLIVSRMNTPELIGAAGVVLNAPTNIFLPDRLWQITFENAHAGYMHYWTLTSLYRAQIQSVCTGTSSSMKNLGQEQFGQCALAFPSIHEQVTIAAFLDRETAKIDELVTEQERLIDLLKEKRQAVISHAVTKGLNPNAPMKDSGIEWLAKIPEHWTIVGLTKYLSSVVDYRGRTPTKVEDGVFLVTARNIATGRIDYAASEEFIAPSEYAQVMSRGVPEIGDVLFTTEAPLGHVANVDRVNVALAQRIIKFRGDARRVNNYFLKYWLLGSFSQADMERLATGSTALGIKGSKIVQLRLCLPPLSQQAAIVAHLDAETAKLDALTTEAQRAIDLLQERRTALISAAVTGQIDVRSAADRSAA